uniref:Luteinizing hormone receptor n=1 Tax=Eriocheir sinensis TaxID=95602 RepID=A0A4D6NXH5_ERISI|nr:luteinizing hormone receptor [Eriocheir sinensis]
MCSDVTSPNPLLLTSTPSPRSRRYKSRVARPSPPMSRPGGNIYEKFSSERFPDQGRTLETWGTIAHGEGGAAAFSLSSPSSEEAGGNTKRHGHSRQFERSHLPFEGSPANLHSTFPQLREVPETTTDAASSSLTRGHARHSGHHTRVLRPQGAFYTEGPDGSGPTSVKPKVRFRRHSHTHTVPHSARVPRSEDAAGAVLRSQTRFRQQAASLIREPDEAKISRPEKRDPHTDHLNFYSNQPRTEFTGGGMGGHIPLPYRFGPFNKTQGRLPQTLSRPNASTQGRNNDVWQEDVPPMDSGDDPTYKLSPAEHPVDLHPDEPGGTTFHAEAGEVWHKPHEGGGTKQTSVWMPGQVFVPTNMNVTCGNLSKDYHDVQCIPGPDAFNPCEDIMGNLALRVAVWLVVVTAVVGNLAVMIVLISSTFKMTVSKFLMVNLALADLCMGLYLLIIAAMDLHTIGDYFNYAIDWQRGPGCKVAGFLTVFASELSIFTLTVITSERWYAITYAIHLNKRLKLSMAVKMMVGGWAYSITMATLPLVGVSSYSKTSICLPMETGDGLSLAYLVSLLLVNGLAFFVITACYASMYFSISRNDAMAPHSDLTVAKRMALLVFTDFACWAPIAFFGLTAVAGLPLINVTRAKILLVFFYPLNSCANPYLYAILTKQYRRDLFILLGRYGFCTKRAMKYKGAYSSVNNTFPPNTGVNAPNHRSSTLTQITLCDLSRSRTSQQSNNGSLLGGTTVVGSQESLQRTPTKPETGCGVSTGENERLSTVQEMSHSPHSDEEAPDDHIFSGDDDSHSSVVKQAGSPHPIKNCYTRLSFTPEQEEILKQALNESKAKKRRGKIEKEDGDPATQELLSHPRPRTKENGSPTCRGEAIVICIREVRPKEIEVDRRGRHRVSSLQEEEEVEEEEDYEELEGQRKVTSTV